MFLPQVDHLIFKLLWQWAKRRHPNKSLRWIKQKYYPWDKGRDWVFSGQIKEPDGRRRAVQLFHPMRLAIVRHVKIQAAANPYDPRWEPYFEKRLNLEMAASLAGRRTLLYLWQQQKGSCPVCQQRITQLTGGDNHPGIWRVYGGADGAANRVLLQPNCHRQVHSQRLEVVKPRPATGE